MTNGSLGGANPDKNYGGAGALMVAGASSGNGIFQTLLKFQLSGAKTQFDAQFGAGNWFVTGISLRLAGNFGTQGAVPNNAIFPAINTGAFGVSWLVNDSWTEGMGSPSAPSIDGLTYNQLSLLTGVGDESLGSFTYVPPGNNISTTWSLLTASGFLADIGAGADASLELFAKDSTISYLFNSRSYGTAGNRPLLTITAIPEPQILGLVSAGVVSLGCFFRKKGK